MKDPKDIQELIDRVGIQIARAKAEWLAGQMSRMLPPDIYVQAYKTSALDKGRVQRWCVLNKVEVQEHTDKIVLVRDGKPISEFIVAFKDGKLDIKISDHEGLKYESLDETGDLPHKSE